MSEEDIPNPHIQADSDSIGGGVGQGRMGVTGINSINTSAHIAMETYE
jgi:hypothetical protein